MRCTRCGWVVGRTRCPCGATAPRAVSPLIPVGTQVVARPGRGPSMFIWLAGEVAAHEGPLHLVRSATGNYWCEADDLLPDLPGREDALTDGARVWALWLDGRWYPGTIDGRQGRLRHVTWDDGDSMWLEPGHIVLLVAEAGEPEVGTVVVAPRWNGEHQLARVEQQDGDRFRVVFSDGEEAWVCGDELATFPPNPFRE
ncbi:MAG TPA: tudor domain-containing protein [Gemmataceae bacterium]|nr:tudor domain-containing protein [Gemmataceae bacterium]